MNPSIEKKLTEAILSFLTPANGGAESVSYIHRNLSRDGWRGLGPLARFEDRCRSLGFVVREGRNNRGQRRIEVSL